MPTQSKMPNPLYAAAGAGDLAMERLKKLPEKVAGLQERAAKVQTELPGRVTVIQDKVTQKVAELPAIVAELRQRVVDTDTDKLRESARRNAGVLMANAQAAQERATALYTELVSRGQKVVDGDTPSERIHAEVLSTEPAPAPVKTTPVAKKTAAKRAPKAPKAS